MKLYPLKFEKVVVPKVWGGKDFNKVLDLNIDDSVNIGELWEVSAHKNGMSYCINGKLKGKSLEYIFENYKDELVDVNKYKQFPLLIKYLDVNDRLSIQVHPTDEVSLKKHNELGKSECWYIIYASEDAKLVLGTKKGIDKEKFYTHVKNKDFLSMFNTYSVKTGDFVDIVPGMVHASIEGQIVLAEIQQSSDITYRIYDFDRLDNGKLRPLHIDESAEAIDFNLVPEIKNVFELNGRIIKNKFYTIDKISVKNKYEDICKDSFIVYMAINGTCNIENLSLKKGETVLIPKNYKTEIKGEVDLLRITLEGE